ncbi:type II secretion system protein [Rubellicoccus peritrichatus]|uniref:Type II secretion system protein n=1 Tax=Rubellicoccus peritrichatus TaxID=3080537 RepID=A0AAQ3LA69_9BACT|nr:type II secretion system protein [Puniceicoccus sp. CR14]WOO41931.1 type II secretion system protein [Puniceicoccus sp. CR14]
MIRGRQRKRGFTLAELIVALVLFSLIAVTMGQAIVNNLQALERLSGSTPLDHDLTRMRHRIMVIENLEELKEGGEIELPTDEGGDPMTVRWTAEVFPTSTLDLFAVDLELEFQGGGLATNREMRLFLYRPNWTEAEDREKLSEAKQLLLEEKRVERGEVRKELEE